jgi:internalin A
LEHLYLSFNQITDIFALSSLNNLTSLDLSNNQISDIKPLVDNSGISNGDSIYLEGNHLSDTSISVYIPQLEARGVNVLW